MRQPDYSGRFRRDVALMQRRGKDMDKLKMVLRTLIEDTPLPPFFHDHPLKGEWSGYRDTHIEPDWLLIYKIYDNVIRFERTGRHGDLFDA